MATQNRELLANVSRLLQPMLPEIVFVGGCVAELLVDDAALSGIRPTCDVDAIIDVRTQDDYRTFSERMRCLGFMEDHTEGAPVCRWRKDAFILDMMPLDAQILGFSNRWYPPAMQFAQSVELASDLHIRVITSPYFCATKLEAFMDRGNDDYQLSSDLEDIVVVIDGCNDFLDQLAVANEDVRVFIATEARNLLGMRRFLDSLPGYFPPDTASQQRIPSFLKKLQQISALLPLPEEP